MGYDDDGLVTSGHPRKSVSMRLTYECGGDIDALTARSDGRYDVDIRLACPECGLPLKRVEFTTTTLLYDSELDGPDPLPALQAGPGRFDEQAETKHEVRYACGCTVVVETFDGRVEYPLDCPTHGDEAVSVEEVE